VEKENSRDATSTYSQLLKQQLGNRNSQISRTLHRIDKMGTTFRLSAIMAHILSTKQALASYNDNTMPCEGSGTTRFTTGQYLMELPNAYCVPTAEENEVSVPPLLIEGARVSKHDDAREI